MPNDWIRPRPLPAQYSEEIVRSDGIVIKVFIDGWKRRIEMPHQITISRPDLGTMYGIDPVRQTYVQFPMPRETMENLEGPDDDEEWRLISEEVFDGQVCDLYESRLKGGDRPHAQVVVDRQSGIRVRTMTLNLAGERVITIESRNLRLGAPDDLFFEIPPGYTREAM